MCIMSFISVVRIASLLVSLSVTHSQATTDHGIDTAKENRMESNQSWIYSQDFLAIIGMVCKAEIVCNSIISGGVICFWGGIWLLGAIFMMVLVAKNYLFNINVGDSYQD